jgi:hypothetical protein
MEFKYNVGEIYIIAVETESESGRVSVDLLESEILFENPETNSYDDLTTMLLVKITNPKNNTSWKEWIDFDDFNDITRALIDKDKYNKIFREQKLERILNENK